ncbi:MAG: Fur family transcriptional regulator [Pseudomonadota bacterium]
MAKEAHNHDVCVANAMELAETLCRERGLRLTPLRRVVLELVWRGHEPVGAYELLDELTKRGHSPSPPTVYRALDFLIQAGLVHRLDSLNAYVGCDDPSHPHESAFLICDQCRNVLELDGEAIRGQIEVMAERLGFGAEQYVLEVQGRCENCRDANVQPSAST